MLTPNELADIEEWQESDENQFRENCKLILRPLSSITDAEAIEVAKMACHAGEWLITRRDSKIISLNHLGSMAAIDLESGWVRTYEGHSIAFVANQPQITDYLRSIAMDIPCYHLGGLTPSQAGLAILKPNEK